MAKFAGAGRGYLNPQRTDESNQEYVTPAKHYDMRKEQLEAKEAKEAEKSYNDSLKMAKGGAVKKPQYMSFTKTGKPAGMRDVMAKGGTASSRADGIAKRGKTRGTIVMCGGGMK